MTKTPSPQSPGDTEQVAKEENLAANPATRTPTKSADPKVERKSEHRTGFSVRVALRWLAHVAINVTTSESFSRPLGFLVVVTTALAAGGLVFAASPTVTHPVAAIALWAAAIAVGVGVLLVGLRFIDKLPSDANNE